MESIVTTYKQREIELVMTCFRVIKEMEGNEVFPHPPAAFEELKALLPDYDHARAMAQGRDKRLVAIKNQLKEKALALLQQVADYVTATCKGDRSLLLSSGFEVADNEAYRPKQKPAIEKLEVVISRPGEAIVRVKNVTAAIAYVHQYTTEEPHSLTKWYGEGSSLRSYTFDNLASEKRHWFRVVAIGYFGWRGYSPVVTKVIQ